MYDLLRGVRVLEVALLAPDALGMHLADLGAEVIKVEQPPHGDYTRVAGRDKIQGTSVMHLRWNRGKKSIALNLKADSGREVFLKLVEESDVVIDGLRAGALGRLGLDYAALRAINPRIVHCSMSGTGQTGPYSRLATHGVAYDAFAGLCPPGLREDGLPYIQSSTPVGIHAGPLYAAFGIAAALVRVAHTGEGADLDVAQMDCAAAWQGLRIDAALNDAESAFEDMSDAVRYQYYEARDGYVLFQASEDKFWRNFCRALGREDLLDRGERKRVADHARGDETLRRELANIFATRTRAEWVRFFLEHDIPGGPVYEAGELAADEHFRARDLLFERDQPELGRLRSFGSPIKLAGRQFSTDAAPRYGQHGKQILSQILGYDARRIQALCESGALDEGS